VVRLNGQRPLAICRPVCVWAKFRVFEAMSGVGARRAGRARVPLVPERKELSNAIQVTSSDHTLVSSHVPTFKVKPFLSTFSSDRASRWSESSCVRRACVRVHVSKGERVRCRHLKCVLCVVCGAKGEGMYTRISNADRPRVTVGGVAKPVLVKLTLVVNVRSPLPLCSYAPTAQPPSPPTPQP
jgi:hypothetical protein